MWPSLGSCPAAKRYELNPWPSLRTETEETEAVPPSPSPTPRPTILTIPTPVPGGTGHNDGTRQPGCCRVSGSSPNHQPSSLPSHRQYSRQNRQLHSPRPRRHRQHRRRPDPRRHSSTVWLARQRPIGATRSVATSLVRCAMLAESHWRAFRCRHLMNGSRCHRQ